MTLNTSVRNSWEDTIADIDVKVFLCRNSQNARLLRISITRFPLEYYRPGPGYTNVLREILSYEETLYPKILSNSKEIDK